MTEISAKIGDRECFVISGADVDKINSAMLAKRDEPPRETENSSARMLRLFIERIERLEDEKKGISEDISDVYSEAKSQGYDAKVMRQVVKLRKMESHKRQEMEAVLETYKAALGLT